MIKGVELLTSLPEDKMPRFVKEQGVTRMVWIHGDIVELISGFSMKFAGAIYIEKGMVQLEGDSALIGSGNLVAVSPCKRVDFVPDHYGVVEVVFTVIF